jgi:mutual gliding-motility protein MglA
MSFINTFTRELFLKIVYCGPGLCGKTANVRFIHASADPSRTGKLISLNTDTERTLFFDFMPVTLGQIRGFTTRLQIYTVPGQVFYRASRELILRGVDGLVFVADSQPERLDANLESLEDTREILGSLGSPFEQLPRVFQMNKRDLPGVVPVDLLAQALAVRGEQIIESAAASGVGVLETLRALARQVVARQAGGKLSGRARPPAPGDG